MPDEDVELQQWSVIKQLFAIVQLQGQQIDALLQSHFRFVSLVGAQFGIEPVPAPEVVSAESIAKMQLGIDELERMFRPTDEPKDGKP